MIPARLLRPYISVLIFLLFSSNAWAQNALTITRIDNASNSSLGDGTTTPIIYGGVTGPAASCAALGASVLCNNCINHDTACNRARVHANAYVTIYFTVSTKISGQIFVGVDDNGTRTPLVLNSDYTRSTNDTLVEDRTGSVSIKWGTLCNLAYGFNSCEDMGGLNPTLTDTIYISVEATDALTAANTKNISLKVLNPETSTANNSFLTCLDASPSAGICSFKARPGDEKIIIDEPIDASPASCPSTFTHTRFYYSKISFDDANYDTGTSADVPMGADCAPSSAWTITGLENDVTYFVRASTLDIAQNNVFLTSEAGQIDLADNCIADDPTFCRFIAQPGNVIGLLPEDLNCFIATAAFGSAFAPAVEIFRAFRNQFLLTNNIGRKFVQFYYQQGPKGAKFISTKSWLRAATRVLLAPPLALAWLSLHYGISGALLIVLSMIGFAIFGLREMRRGQR